MRQCLNVIFEGSDPSEQGIVWDTRQPLLIINSINKIQYMGNNYQLHVISNE